MSNRVSIYIYSSRIAILEPIVNFRGRVDGLHSIAYRNETCDIPLDSYGNYETFSFSQVFEISYGF